ncbi:TRAP transporter substrate-binding protein [Salipiger pacificus]|uniref:TRAP transporter substrate-binding protein n=2 Tax=Salipiger mangrovisoli TaxID=2865933 RepID=A0ABR9X598_9RHOB|nr:TRAP transporter substrate-binding protein [Salipiger mangrovisoli]
MQSVYPSSLPVIGTAALRLVDQVETLTGGSLELTFHEPNAIVSGGEMWDAISTGAVDAGWYTPGFAEAIIPAATIFTAVPFGPDVREYSAWWYHGGGQEIWTEITAPYEIHTELCGVLAPEASGWFAKPIESPEDLAGLKMRAFGLVAQVMSKLGVQAQSLPPSDTMTGLRLGTIDAAEMAFPAIDNALGMAEYAKHYYFPGWHQQNSLLTFIVNQHVWDDLDEQQRAAIQNACAANVTYMLAEGEAIQVAALEDLADQGVEFHTWNDEMMDSFQAAWGEVVKEQVAADKDFARAWESLSEFRQNFKLWSDRAYIR